MDSIICYLLLLLRDLSASSSSIPFGLTEEKSGWEKLSFSNTSDDESSWTIHKAAYNLPDSVYGGYDSGPSSSKRSKSSSLSEESQSQNQVTEPSLADMFTFPTYDEFTSMLSHRLEKLRLTTFQDSIWDTIEKLPRAASATTSTSAGKEEDKGQSEYSDWTVFAANDEVDSDDFYSLTHPDMNPFYYEGDVDDYKFEDDSDENEEGDHIDLCDHLGTHLSIGGRYRPAITGSPDLGLGVCSHDQFKIIKTVGEGAYGQVYSAIHKKTGTKVALKYLFGNTEDDHMFARHEECIMHRLGDFLFTPKHYCTFLNEHGVIVIAMELIDGIELFELIYKEEVFMEDGVKQMEEFVYQYSKQDIATWASEFIAAFMYMHGLGITYRDFKPENVIITKSGHVKIVDYGFASLHNRPHYHSANQMLGTPLYVPPEHITPKRITTFSKTKSFDHPAGDWYSLGIVLYEAAFRQYPIENERDLSVKQIDNLIRKGFRCDKGEEWKELCDLINGFFRLDPQERLGIAEDSEVIFRLSPFLRAAPICQLIDDVKHKLAIED